MVPISYSPTKLLGLQQDSLSLWHTIKEVLVTEEVGPAVVVGVEEVARTAIRITEERIHAFGYADILHKVNNALIQVVLLFT